MKILKKEKVSFFIICTTDIETSLKNDKIFYDETSFHLNDKSSKNTLQTKISESEVCKRCNDVNPKKWKNQNLLISAKYYCWNCKEEWINN